MISYSYYNCIKNIGKHQLHIKFTVQPLCLLHKDQLVKCLEMYKDAEVIKQHYVQQIWKSQ